jgi:predicted Zn-dependent peptidase
MNAYLGGGMSAVLFQKIREDRGLAYVVDTFQDFYRDDGVFGAYLGTDDAHVRQAFALMLAEFRKLKIRKLPKSKLDRVKTFMKGNLSLALESTSSKMNRIARQELVTGEYLTIREVMKRLDRVTVSDILDLANRVFDESQMSIAVLGPVDNDMFSDVS